jgi:hypothetical protein
MRPAMRCSTRGARTWAKAALRSDKDKPPGVFPASLRWPDAAFNGDEPTWHRANMFWRYFDWRGDGQLYDQLLCSWVRTGDDALLVPLRRHARAAAGVAGCGETPAAAPEGSAGLGGGAALCATARLLGRRRAVAARDGRRAFRRSRCCGVTRRRTCVIRLGGERGGAGGGHRAQPAGAPALQHPAAHDGGVVHRSRARGAATSTTGMAPTSSSRC